MIRLYAETTNTAGQYYRISIYDTELVANENTPFVCDPYFFRIKFEGSQDDTFKRIIPSNVQFTVLFDVPSYTIAQNNAIKAFYEDLASSYEGRFYVRVQKGKTLGNIKYIFYGKVLPDIGDLVLGDIKDFTVTAIDGLTDLKDIEYRPTAYSDLLPEFSIQTKTFNAHFLDILKRIDTIQYFNTFGYGGNILFTTSAGWTVAEGNPSLDLFNQIRVRNYWFEQKTPSYRKYQSCYSVLEELLTGLNARLYYADGIYHFEQLGNQDQLVTSRYGYDYNGDVVPSGPLTYGAKIQHNYNAKPNMHADPRPVKKRLVAFKAVELENSKQFTNYMNGMNIVVDSSDDGPSTNPIHSFDYIIGTGNKLVTQWNADFRLDDSFAYSPVGTPTAVRFMLTFKVKIGDYYMIADNPLYVGNVVELVPNNQFHVTPSYEIPVLNWTLVDSTVTLSWKADIYKDDAGEFMDQLQIYISNIKNSHIVLESSEIIEDGVMVFEWLDFKMLVNNASFVSAKAKEMALLKTSRIIIASGYNDLYEQPKGIKRYEVADIRNTFIYPIKFNYYDSLDSTMSQLFVRGTYTIGMDTTTFDYPTSVWTDADAGLTLPLQELLLKTLLAMRAKPSSVYLMSIFYTNDDTLSMQDTVVINGLKYLPINLEFTCIGQSGLPTYKVALWELFKDYDGVNVIDTGEPIVLNPQFPIPDGTLDSFRLGNSKLEVAHYEEFTNVSTNFITPDTLLSSNFNIDDAFRIKTKCCLTINGVKQTYDPLVTRNRRYKFDLVNNRIMIFKGAGNVDHIELIIYY